MRARVRLLVAAVAMLVTVAVAGCSAIGPNNMPSVRPGVGPTYSVAIEFTSVNNLPTGADVMMNGRRIGEVQKLTLNPQSVDVRVGLRRDTPIATSVKAVIRQNTVLGDTYIALVPDPTAPTAPMLHDHDTIPLSQTSSPPPLEDMIAVLAYFVNGGSIQQIQDTMGKLNSVLPNLTEVRSLSGTVATDLSNLSSHLNEVDRTVTSMRSFAGTLDSHGDELSTLFSPATSNYWLRMWRDIVAHIGTILPSIGSVFEGGLWLTPMLTAVAKAAESGRVGWDAAPGTIDAVKQLLGDKVTPFVTDPKVDVTTVRDSAGNDITQDVLTVLQMLGVAN